MRAHDCVQIGKRQGFVRTEESLHWTWHNPGMRWARTVIVLIACATLLPASLDAAAVRPSLRIVERDPLTLVGRAFRAEELVRVTVRSGATTTRIRKARADGTGKFTLAFAGVRLDRCSGDLEVTASGARGSKATFTLRRLDCADRADR